jgi:hypothetical protein
MAGRRGVSDLREFPASLINLRNSAAAAQIPLPSGEMIQRPLRKGRPHKRGVEGAGASR